MKYSINVKYWSDGHDHEIFFAYKTDAYHVFKALRNIAPNTENDIEFISLWDEENAELLECIHF
jgi:hypothetical protein